MMMVLALPQLSLAAVPDFSTCTLKPLSYACLMTGSSGGDVEGAESSSKGADTTEETIPAWDTWSWTPPKTDIPQVIPSFDAAKTSAYSAIIWVQSKPRHKMVIHDQHKQGQY